MNLAHFCIPQFAEVFPDRYQQNWKAMPREIPDTFVRRFGEWCHEHGVKGKYSVIPNPACVGWVDRDIPGWSKRELDDRLELVRTLMMPDWDIHPEMVTHTWVIDTKTGRPYPERSERVMENFGWSEGKSVDELADYLSYALRILSKCRSEMRRHYYAWRIWWKGAAATRAGRPKVVSRGLPRGGAALLPPRFSGRSERRAAGRICIRHRDARSAVCSFDHRLHQRLVWRLGRSEPGDVDRFITADLRSGRLPEVIRRGEPAVMACHWAGLYYNGQEQGFRIFQEVVRRLHSAYDNLIWMKLSEIARYWAARELTAWQRHPTGVIFHAPYACPAFTVQLGGTMQPEATPRLKVKGQSVPLGHVDRPLDLKAGAWTRRDAGIVVCFDLARDPSELALAAG